MKTPSNSGGRSARDHRKMATHFPSLRDDFGHVVHMFREDITVRIVPYRARGRKDEGFEAVLAGDQAEQDRAIAVLRSVVGRDRREITELLSDVIKEIVRWLVWEGEALFELARPDDGDNVVYLSSFTSKRVFSIPGYYIQVVPLRDQEMWNQRVGILPKRDVWRVSVPRALGGARGYKRIVHGLSRFSGVMPYFMRQHGQMFERTFDLETYRREKEIMESRLTRRWGWNRRDFSQRNWTEFALFYRMTTFAWAEAVLREHVVDELNRLFIRLGINVTITVTGIPTGIEVMRLRDQMVEGELSYSKAYEATKTA